MIHNFFFLLFAGLLVLLNGFFVAAEFGLVKLRPTRVRAIAKTLGWRGRILTRVHGQLDAYLSACQLGITLASLGLGWIGEPAFAKLLTPLLHTIGMDNQGLIDVIAFFMAFFTISYLHIVVGELVPKSLAIRAAERVGLWTAPALYGFYWLMYPAIWCLNHSSNFVLKMLGLQSAPSHDAHYSSDELKVILRSSRADEKFSRSEWRVLAQAIDFRELDVADLMRPFHEAVVLHEEDGLQANLEKITQNRYSRYPYIDQSGKVIGMVHLKDIFLTSQKGELDDLEDLLRPINMVSPDMPATELFRRFQQGAPHLTVVGYEGNPPIGFVTLDNLLSALVGEIRDEFRQAKSEWTKLEDGSLLGKASLPIPTLERTLGIDIESTSADTVGGLILWKLGDLPEEGQKIDFEQFSIVVKKMIGPRILLVRVYPKSDDHMDDSG